MKIIGMNRFASLRSPEPEGGGGGAAPEIVSHDADAGELFGEKAPAAPAAGEGTAKPDAGTPPPAAGTAPAEGTKPEGAKPAPSIFSKKPAAPAPGAAAPAGAAPERITLDIDKVDLHANAAPATKEQFKQVKLYAKQLAGDIAARDAKIAELEKRPGVATPELEKLRGEHKSLSDRLAVLDLQHHPKFVAQFVEPKNKILAGVQEVLTGNNVAGVDLAGILNRPRAEFMKGAAEIAAKLPEYERSAFMDDMRRAFALEGDARAALGDSTKLRDQLQAQTTERARAAFEGVANEFSIGLEPFDIPADASTEDRTSLEGYNTALGQIRANAEKLAFGSTDEAGTATIAMKAATLDFINTQVVPRMEHEYKQMAGMVTTLTAELAKLKAARRGGEGGGGGGEDPNAEPESHEAAAAKLFAGSR